MVVVSECSFVVDPDTKATFVKNVISYDWRVLDHVDLESRCKDLL